MKIFVQIILVLLFINLSFAQTNYYVSTSGSDANDGSQLQPWATIEHAVISAANPATEIIINVTNGVYNLNNNQIDINRGFTNLTILGQNTLNTIVQSASDTSLSISRVFKIYAGNTVTLKKMTVRYGRILEPEANGGGILNSGGTLIIDYCKVTENFGGFTGYGGGIATIGGNLTINNSTVTYNSSDSICYGAGVGSNNGILNIYNSNISYNSAFSTGGIAVMSNNADVIFNMENSTLYGNTASYRFGGIRLSIFGADSFIITTNLKNCTIANNSALNLYGGIGLPSLINFNIKNSIVSGNTSNGNPDDIRGTNLIPIEIVSGGYNLLESINNITINGEQNNGIGLNPNLLPLANNNTTNGTQTCATLLGSPAIDAIPGGNGAPLLDQRGYQRNGDYDIGAYEYAGIPLIFAPTNLAAVADTFAIVLNWTDNSTNESGFYVERKNGDTLSTDPFFVIDTVLADIESFNDLGITPNTTYTYRVQAFDLLNLSPHSNEVSATTITDVNDKQVIVNSYELDQNFPNPFNPSTKISWQSPIGIWQTLKIYDVLGKEVATLLDEFKPAGSYEIEFDASELSSGMYIYKLSAGGPLSGSGQSFVQTRKMILLK